MKQGAQQAQGPGQSSHMVGQGGNGPMVGNNLQVPSQ